MVKKTYIKNDGKKELLELEVIRHESKKLYFPITSARCRSGICCVDDGCDVKVGELIGERVGPFFRIPIHSTVSGVFLPREKMVDETGKKVECMVVENDQKYQLDDYMVERTDEEISNFTKEDFVKIVQEAGIVGLGGAAFPTYVKLDTDKEINVVVGNGIECEPFMISDYMMMMDYPEKVIQGMLYVLQSSKAPKGIIAIKGKHHQLYQRLTAVLAEQFPDAPVEIKKIGSHYPEGWEIETVKYATGIEVPQGKILADYGVLNFNVTTLKAIYDAVKYNRPITEKYVTISGDGIKNGSFLVKVGTPVKELIDLLGGYQNLEIPKLIIQGGPMMGVNTLSDDIVVTDTTSSIIINNRALEIESEPCIRCGECVRSCPVLLEPITIYNALGLKDVDKIISLEANRCIDCGICSYVCPSKIPLTESMAKAKKLIAK